MSIIRSNTCLTTAMTCSPQTFMREYDLKFHIFYSRKSPQFMIQILNVNHSVICVELSKEIRIKLDRILKIATA